MLQSAPVQKSEVVAARRSIAGRAIAPSRRIISLQRMELASAVGLALAQHPEIGRADAAISQAGAEVSVAEAAWYPKLAYTSNVSGVHQASAAASLVTGNHVAGLEASQLIYDFGRSQSALTAASAVKRQREAELNDTRERVALTTSEAHLEVARGTILLGAAGRYLLSLKRLQEIIGLRAASGAADQADVFFADVKLKGAEGENVRTQTKLTTAVSNLYRVIGVRAKTVADPKRIIAEIERTLVGASLDGSAGVEAAENQAAAARARILGVEASLYPSVSLKASQTRPIADPLRAQQTLFGLSIQGDIFNGGASAARILSAKQEALAAENAIALAKLHTNVTVDTALADISGAIQRRKIFIRQAELARQSRDIFLSEYQIGKRTLTEVLNAEQEIFRAESEQINAVADTWLAVVRAAAARGALVRSLQGASG